MLGSWVIGQGLQKLTCHGAGMLALSKALTASPSHLPPPLPQATARTYKAVGINPAKPYAAIHLRLHGMVGGKGCRRMGGRREGSS